MLLFAHRGGLDGGHRPNSLAAFRDAVERGCAVESDVRLSADGVPVLVHDAVWLRGVLPVVTQWFRASWMGVCTVREALDGLPGVQLSLDLKDPRAVAPVLAALGADAGRVWLVHHDLALLSRVRSLNASVRLVHEAPLSQIGPPEEHLSELARRGVDAQNTRWSGWTPALVSRAHELGVLAFGSLAQTVEELDKARGLDAIYSDHLELMTSLFGPA
jgi:glycerophosphoryl diester phosphodiesterase